MSNHMEKVNMLRKWVYPVCVLKQISFLFERYSEPSETLNGLCSAGSLHTADTSSVGIFSCVIISSPDNRLNFLSFALRHRKFRRVSDSLSLQKTSKRASNDLQLTGLLRPHCLLDITSETLDLFSCVTPARIATYPVNPPILSGHGRTLINRQSSIGLYQNPHGGVVINTVLLRCWVTAKLLKMSLWIRSRPQTDSRSDSQT